MSTRQNYEMPITELSRPPIPDNGNNGPRHYSAWQEGVSSAKTDIVNGSDPRTLLENALIRVTFWTAYAQESGDAIQDQDQEKG